MWPIDTFSVYMHDYQRGGGIVIDVAKIFFHKFWENDRQSSYLCREKKLTKFPHNYVVCAMKPSMFIILFFTKLMMLQVISSCGQVFRWRKSQTWRIERMCFKSLHPMRQCVCHQMNRGIWTYLCSFSRYRLDWRIK